MPRKKIIDQFTDRPVSRQERYQLRQAAAGRCRIHGIPATGGRCDQCRMYQAVWRSKKRPTQTPYKGKWLVKAGVRPPPAT